MKLPYSFLELDDRRFEDLVRQLAASSEIEWSRPPEPLGRLGADQGTDIRGYELSTPPTGNAVEREWRYQVKRLVEIHPKEIEGIVQEAIPDPKEDEVRASASVWFRVGALKSGVPLPEEWYADWATAFVLAAITDGYGRLYCIEEILSAVVAEDPALVERWLTRQLQIRAPFWRLSSAARAALGGLPRANRERLISIAKHDHEALGALIGEDAEWVAELLADGRLSTDQVVTALDDDERPLPERVGHLLRFAPVLIDRGVAPQSIAVRVMFGNWIGDESAHYEAIRSAFEAAEPGDSRTTRSLREAGMVIFAAYRDRARQDEHRRRVSGGDCGAP